MKLTICSENQNIPVEFTGRMSITFEHGSSAENFIFTPDMMRAALIKYAEQIERMREMTKMVKDDLIKRGYIGTHLIKKDEIKITIEKGGGDDYPVIPQV